MNQLRKFDGVTMEIQRIPSHRNRSRGWKPVVKATAVDAITIDEDRNIEILFWGQTEPYSSAQYDYKITLTPDDIGKIMGEVYKQALSKNE
jgi:hypothetical protein